MLILVAGTTKDEGFVTALALVVLVAARSIGWAGLRGERKRWVIPLAIAGVELAVLLWWPTMIRVIGARGASSSFTTRTELAQRTTATVHGMSPYLHVLVVALPLAAVGGLVLSGVRRRSRIGNDLWAWVALAVGLCAVGAVLVASTSPIGPWILSTVHRITEFPILEAWWIVGVWAVVGAAGLTGPIDQTVVDPVGVSGGAPVEASAVEASAVEASVGVRG